MTETTYEEYLAAVEAQRVRDRDRWQGVEHPEEPLYSAETGVVDGTFHTVWNTTEVALKWTGWTDVESGNALAAIHEAATAWLESTKPLYFVVSE